MCFDHYQNISLRRNFSGGRPTPVVKYFVGNVAFLAQHVAQEVQAIGGAYSGTKSSPRVVVIGAGSCVSRKCAGELGKDQPFSKLA